MYDFSFVPEYLLKYYVHSGSMLQNLNVSKDVFESEGIFIKHHDRYLRYPNIYHMTLRQLGSKFCSMGELEKGRSYYRESLQSNPMNLKIRLLYLGSLILGKRAFKIIYNLKKKYSGIIQP